MAEGSSDEAFLDEQFCLVVQCAVRLSSFPQAPRGTPAFPLPPPGGGRSIFEEGKGQQLWGSADRRFSQLLASNAPGTEAQLWGSADRRFSQLLASNAPGTEEPKETQRALPETGDSTTSRLPTTLLPLHPYLQRRLLASGLEVFVLPHAHPEGSLEVHLEMHAGSTAEAENERGMAHLCEHLVFMGNRRRGEVVALQGEANAFTDFHHTVYFVSWRGGEGNGSEGQKARRGQEQQTASRQDWSLRRLRAALEMMREVFTAPTQFTAERLLKEKAAVISESSLVNTIFYRKEQAQLSKLHSDTILPSRFPIGDMGLLRSWSVEDVHKFFARFYRPENATLYIVGDMAPLAALDCVDNILGYVQGDRQGEAEWRVLRDRWLQSTVKKHSVFFPPLAHAWTKEDKIANAAASPAATNTVKANGPGSPTEKTDSSAVPLASLLKSRLHAWQHPLLQHFSLLFLRKLPIAALQTAGDFFRLLARKLALQALAVRQMAEHGVSETELGSLLDSYKVNLDRMHMQLLSSGDMLRLLMDSTACGHRVVHLEDERSLALQLARGELRSSPHAGDAAPGNQTDTTDSEKMKRLLALVNEEARSMLKWMNEPISANGMYSGPDAICAFLVQSGEPRSTGNSCQPQRGRIPSTQLQGHIEMEHMEMGTVSAEGAELRGTPGALADDGHNQTRLVIPTETILSEVCDAMTHAVPSKREGVETPKYLLTNEELEVLRRRAAESPPVVQRLKEAGPNAQTLQFASGAKVTIKPLAEERGSALIRVLIPGGRLASKLDSARSAADSREVEALRQQSAAMVVGAMTMMEGGAVGNFTRQQIEAFCQERLIGSTSTPRGHGVS
ncbi:uncharacterized protein EMH_0075450 [Eimeria mitis]|uniref:M16 family peptidase n=1 Tax=Eimeria mitis TaxID=44415 RepID=U6KAI2_9EIME|nr:uncharacterized protein EMH_0075450 [Eimeria mitis]CDJ32488.1 hypothetical protein EMH_0075450 [Eimeria mitis]